jgi:polar amino acid transport system permease protein
MEALGQQFFNLSIMQTALPLLLLGLRQTLVLCLLVIPLGLAGGLAVALLSRLIIIPGSLGSGRGH